MDRTNRGLGDYAVHLAREGFSSIRQVSSGEIMHSRTPPLQEAKQLYVDQSRLVERLVRVEGDGRAHESPLIIWDVGLGAAANAMAAIFCYEEAAARTTVRALEIVSFEADLDPLRLAMRYRTEFPYLEHDGPDGILKEGVWKSERPQGISWLLIPGNFLETMPVAPGPPDLIFYDMFSSKASGDVWRLDAFRKLFHACAGHASELFTYTCSTANRVRLLAAGFYVAKGRNAGDKIETTIALTPAAAHNQKIWRNELLAEDWLKKWSRSRAQFPEEVPTDRRAAFERQIRGHPQFAEVG